MVSMHVKYLLTGAGIAASSAAVEIRNRDPEGAMLLVGQEPHRPYHRPPLSKGWLRADAVEETMFTLPENWFTARRVDLRTGTRVARLDVLRHTATLDNGQEVAYDRLLLATGATPRTLDVPGARLPNLLNLRTLEDADRLRNTLNKAIHEGRPHASGRGRVTVVGGGVLGVELAAAFTSLGLGVDLVVPQAYPLDRFAGDTLGPFITRWLEGHGVTVHTNSSPLRVEGDGRVQRVVLDPDRVIPCDFVLSAIGIQPNKDLLRGTSIAAEKHILADAYGRTNQADIYAAGDCCAIFDPRFGKHRVLDHSESAAEMGRVAGANMSGGDVAWSGVGHYAIEVFGLTIEVWGEAKQIARRIVRGQATSDAPAFAEIGIAADHRIVHVAALGSLGSDARLEKLVAQRVNALGIEDALRDPALPWPITT